MYVIINMEYIYMEYIYMEYIYMEYIYMEWNIISQSNSFAWLVDCCCCFNSKTLYRVGRK